MRRTGRALGSLAMLLTSAAALADVEFYQRADRNEVGLDDTFRLTIVVSDAPDSSNLQFPSSNDFEILSKSQSSQMSYQLGGGASGVLKRTQKYVLLMRANRTGDLTLPPSVLTIHAKSYRTEPVRITVKKGHLQDPRAGAQRGSSFPDPFRRFPFPSVPGFDDEEDSLPDVDVPRSESDLFLRASLDRDEVYVGDQTTLSIHIFSRVDLSSVDAVTMPKLDGFWSEDLESPSQLTGEQKVINGIPYRAYLLKRRALFPVKPGTAKIGSAEADITTGFLFAGRRVHRVGNELSLKVKPLPPGAPPNFSAANVGRWRISTEVAQGQLQLGQPASVKVILEGKGNLKNIVLPSLSGPASLRIYDPTTSDKMANSKGKVGGRRTQEYLVMAQQTGSFTLPPLSFPFFNPETGRYEVVKTEPLTLTVLPGPEGSNLLAQGPSGAKPDGVSAKNVLAAGGLRPLRYQAHFTQARPPLWQRRFFVPALLAPIGAWLAIALIGFVRARLTEEDETSLKRKQARAARRRLAAAEKLKLAGKPAAFFGEVEKALIQFLEAKLGGPLAGLTRDALDARLHAAGASEDRRMEILRVLEACDLGRFAPGADPSSAGAGSGDPSTALRYARGERGADSASSPYARGEREARERVLDSAAAAMEGWESR